MKYSSIECLVAIYDQVDKSAFTLSRVKPALEQSGHRVNGSILKALCQAHFIKQFADRDLHTVGSHFVHLYRITPEGEIMVFRQKGANTEPDSASKIWRTKRGIELPQKYVDYIKTHYGSVPLVDIARTLRLSPSSLSQKMTIMRSNGEVFFDMSGYLLTEEVAEILGVKDGTVRDYARKGVLPSKRVGIFSGGRRRIYLKEDVETFRQTLGPVRLPQYQKGPRWYPNDREYIKTHYGFESVRTIAKSLGCCKNTAVSKIRAMRSEGEILINLDDYLSADQASEVLGVTKTTVLRYAGKGMLPPKRLYLEIKNGRLFFLKEDVEALKLSRFRQRGDMRKGVIEQCD